MKVHSPLVYGEAKFQNPMMLLLKKLAPFQKVEKISQGKGV